MNEALENAMKVILEKIADKDTNINDAMAYSNMAVNLAQVKAQLSFNS